MVRNVFLNNGEHVQHGFRQTHKVQCKMGILITTGAEGQVYSEMWLSLL